MLKTENLGDNLIRTYSDLNVKIERDGVLYDEAIDPTDSGRHYVETNEAIEIYDEQGEKIDDEAGEADYIEALQTLGVEVS